MIEVHNLTRRYGDFTAVDGISFKIEEGEIVGMLGPNGAGKTTTLRMLTGFLPPTRGQLSIGGRDLLADPLAARKEIGYLPENVALYPEMRVIEYLRYRAGLEGMSRARARVRITEVMQSCILSEVETQIIGTLSKGYRQRVGLAAAILHDPSVLILDEPTVGLDPRQIIAIRDLIRDLGKEQTLLISSHILPEVELLCDRVIIIDRGVIVGEGSPADLRETGLGSPILRVELKDPPPDAASTLRRLEGVVGVDVDDVRAWKIETDPALDLRELVFRTAVERGWILLGMSQERATLEDIFVRLTTRESADGAPSESDLADESGEDEEPLP